MPYEMNNHKFLMGEQFINYSKISLPEFGESAQIARQSDLFYRFSIFRKPLYISDYLLSYRFIELLKVFVRIVNESNFVPG